MDVVHRLLSHYLKMNTTPTRQQSDRGRTLGIELWFRPLSPAWVTAWGWKQPAKFGRCTSASSLLQAHIQVQPMTAAGPLHLAKGPACHEYGNAVQ